MSSASAGRPPSGASVLPGRRAEPIRAWMTAPILTTTRAPARPAPPPRLCRARRQLASTRARDRPRIRAPARSQRAADRAVGRRSPRARALAHGRGDAGSTTASRRSPTPCARRRIRRRGRPERDLLVRLESHIGSVLDGRIARRELACGLNAFDLHGRRDLTGVLARLTADALQHQLHSPRQPVPASNSTPMACARPAARTRPRRAPRSTGRGAARSSRRSRQRSRRASVRGTASFPSAAARTARGRLSRAWSTACIRSPSPGGPPGALSWANATCATSSTWGSTTSTSR